MVPQPLGESLQAGLRRALDGSVTDVRFFHRKGARNAKDAKKTGMASSLASLAFSRLCGESDVPPLSPDRRFRTAQGYARRTFPLSAMTELFEPWPLPFWTAHRGAGRRAPENTLAAFREGFRLGWRAFECDVKLSADGVLFLLHDTELDRTTSGRGLAGRLDWARLAELDAGSWHGPGFTGEPLPTLETIARFCLDHDCALDIEIKPTPGLETETGDAVARAAARLWHGRTPPVLSSFAPAALAAAQAAVPALPRVFLIDKWRDGWLDEARALGCVAVMCNFRLLDAAMIQRIHDAGMRSLAYTVNDAGTAERLRAAGLDGLVTDAVDRFDPSTGTYR
jgi:glycerophosphoryl diester phosphodiesterase